MLISPNQRPTYIARATVNLNKYVNDLKLSVYFTDVTVNLSQTCEHNTFIGNLCQGKEFLDKTHDERHSNDPTKQAMYTQGNLVGILESVAKQICPSCHIPNDRSPIPKMNSH